MSERQCFVSQIIKKTKNFFRTERAFFTLSSVFVNDLSKIINNNNNFKSHCTVIVILCGFDSLFECFVFDKGHEITSAVLWGFQTKLEAVKFRNFISQYPQLLTLYTSMLFRLLLVVEKKNYLCLMFSNWNVFYCWFSSVSNKYSFGDGAFAST